MVIRTGVDVVEVSRIRQAYEKFGERFLNRVFLPREVSYCFAQQAAGPSLAARFAAKEAISKAFGTGIGREVGWRDLEIGRKVSGEPFVILHGGGYRQLLAQGAQAMHLSLSHTNQMAAAVAVLCRNS